MVRPGERLASSAWSHAVSRRVEDSRGPSVDGVCIHMGGHLFIPVIPTSSGALTPTSARNQSPKPNFPFFCILFGFQ